MNTANTELSGLEETPISDASHQYVAQRVIAFCAAYVDQNLTKAPAIDTDKLIAAACKQFGVTTTSRAFQEVFEMRDDYLEVASTSDLNSHSGPIGVGQFFVDRNES